MKNQKAIIVEQNGMCVFFDYDAKELVVYGRTEDEHLDILEHELNAQGLITHGAIFESDKPSIPSGWNDGCLKWDKNTSTLVYDIPRVEAAKRINLCNQINAIFAEKEKSTQVVVNGIKFNGGDKMKQNLDRLVNGDIVPSGARVKQADGVRVVLTTQLYTDLSIALATAYSDLLNPLEDHLDAIAVADNSMLDSYDVNAGWP